MQRQYLQHWSIETLFGCLKAKGFNLESTHVTDPTRLGNLMIVVAIAFAWCHLAGAREAERRPIRLKTHGRKSDSIFRYVLNALYRILVGFHEGSAQKNSEISNLFHVDHKAITPALPGKTGVVFFVLYRGARVNCLESRPPS